MILSIETSTTACSVAVHDKESLLGSQRYQLEKSHASLLPGVIDQLLENIGIGREDLGAIAVSEGPGSYTGLRIGTAIAKGICMGLEIPLIAVPTLDLLIESIRHSILHNAYLIPMLDARRMEVYAKVVDQDLQEVWSTQPIILEENSFDSLTDQPIFLFGNGAAKCKNLFDSTRVNILNGVEPDAGFMGKLAHDKFGNGEFSDLAYFEPNYLKPFHSKPSKKNLLV